MAENTKSRAPQFTEEEQQLIVQAFEEVKHVINRKGNTKAINNSRVKAWQSIANRVNA